MPIKKRITIKEIKELLLKGLSTCEIASHFNRTERGFYTYCSTNDISLVAIRKDLIKDENLIEKLL